MRIEVRALDVLDDGVFERGPVVDLDDDHRHLVQAGHLRRAPAPLAGDDFIHRGLIGHRPHQDRLHDAALADRPGQGFDLICFEVLAWVARIGAQESIGILRCPSSRSGAGSSSSPMRAARPRPSRELAACSVMMPSPCCRRACASTGRTTMCPRDRDAGSPLPRMSRKLRTHIAARTGPPHHRRCSGWPLPPPRSR